ncbi:glycosyltransferase [Candidatus Daviesbacteria bacterium]|nr:glycosyltransferase [Candidatus Daviesbacteria bacterium]
MFLAGSENAKNRIKKIYGRDSQVVYPFVDLDRFKDAESFDGGYFLVLARPNKYKRVDLVQKACNELNLELKVVFGDLDEKAVVQVLAGCRALIIPGIEDFGLVSLEAQALGKPVIAFSGGGALETVIDGKTGVFFESQTVDSLKEVLKNFDPRKFNSLICKANAQKFGKENFIKNFKQTVASLV